MGDQGVEKWRGALVVAVVLVLVGGAAVLALVTQGDSSERAAASTSTTSTSTSAPSTTSTTAAPSSTPDVEAPVSVPTSGEPVAPSGVWELVGSGIDGFLELDEFGQAAVAVSADGQTVATGTRTYEVEEVRVFRWSEDGWQQRGSSIRLEPGPDAFGQALNFFSMSVELSADGDTVAALSPADGIARVFEFVDGDWVQLGEDLQDPYASDSFGAAVALSGDGETVVLGTSIAFRPDPSRVRAFRFDGTDWVQVGDDIVRGGAFGHLLDVSFDGDTFAAAGGAYLVVVFRFDGSEWSSHAIPRAGRSRLGGIALSADGDTLIVSGPNLLEEDQLGHVRVWRFDGADWVQLGTDIIGETLDDAFGASVAASADGETVVVGVPGFRGPSDHFGSRPSFDPRGSNSLVRVFRFDGSDWQQLGSDINSWMDGEGFGVFLGTSADGETVAVSAPEFGTRSTGQLRVFQLEQER